MQIKNKIKSVVVSSVMAVGAIAQRLLPLSQPVRQAQVMITQSSYSIPSTSTMRICAAIRLRRQASFPGEVTVTHRIPLQVASTMQATM